MSRVRLLVLSLALLGLVFSSWSARPSDSFNADGWFFAVLWSSLAWCLSVALCLLPARGAKPWGAAGAFLALAASELLIFAFALDPLLLAVKPIYQVPLLLVGVAIGSHLSAHQPRGI